MDKEKLLKIIEQFKDKKILVLGDIMLDKYIWGEVSRISPEAPVQVVNVAKESYAPGGAANVANNIAALSPNVVIVGVVGNDNTKDILITELKKRNINVSGIFIDENKPTIQKVRVCLRHLRNQLATSLNLLSYDDWEAVKSPKRLEPFH